ncbi:MAG: hypothetical protein M1828_004208 [Chrysothrix sp. TS-e1954]|nr:MAG: hypothetical protein M1828_004208 [Chrysothrix sp. TS-e1954]
MSSQFEQGHMPPTQFQNKPGLQSNLEGPKPTSTNLPTEDGGYQKYKAAGKLAGKKALITGGDSGIGRATAILYAMEGADVFIAYLPQEEDDAAETKKRVEEHGHKCFTHATDLRKVENCKTTIEKAVQQLGTINVLFLNHAFQNTINDIADLSIDQWHTTFDTNIHPFFYLSKFALPHLEQGDTVITNASVNAYIGRPDLLDYTSTKGAIVAFTRGLSNQLLGRGIRVNAVAPGPVWTPLIAATMGKEQQDQFSSPMGRPAQPSEIATCCVFLASTDSSAISGQTIHCNGGVIVNG